MTGFVVVTGPTADRLSLAELRERVQPDGGALQAVHRRPGVAMYATSDLPVIDQPAFVAVGDISLPDPEAMQKTVLEQRRAGMQALVEAHTLQNDIGPGFAEDYHFVAWDERSRTLVGGRDGLGVRPLFYMQDGASLIVASAVRFILGVGISEALDDESIVRFVVGRPPHAKRTYLRDVSRVAPGGRVTQRLGSNPEFRACEPPIAQPRQWPGGDTADAFGQAFSAAVRKRLAQPSTTTILLSGGLDSSSIAVVAADLCRSEALSAPETLSLVFDETPQWSERRYIADVQASRSLEGAFLEGQTTRPLADLPRHFAEHGGLFAAPGLTIGTSLYAHAAHAGHAVMLDGHGGDEVVSYGWGRLHSLARDGRWRTLWETMRGVADGSGDRRSKLFALYWMKYGPAQRWVSRAVRLKRAVARRVTLRPDRDAHARMLAPTWRSHFSPSGEADAVLETAPSLEAAQHYATVTQPQQAMAMETLHAAASAAGVSARYPFWDRDLIAVCLSLPEEAKLDAEGLARAVLRRSVDLPLSVRERRDKLDFSPHLALGLVDGEGAWFDQLIDERSEAPVWRFVDRNEARRALKRLRRRRERASGDLVQGLWRVGVLAMWLDERAARGLSLVETA